MIHKRHFHHYDDDEGKLSPSYRSFGAEGCPHQKPSQGTKWDHGKHANFLRRVVRKRIVTLVILSIGVCFWLFKRRAKLWCSLVKSKRKILADEEGFQFPYQPYQSAHLDETGLRRNISACVVSLQLSQVGLLFLTHGRIVNEGAWKQWFSYAHDKISIPHSILDTCARGPGSVPITREAIARGCKEAAQNANNVIDRQHLFDVWVHLSKDIDDEIFEGSIFKSKLIPESKRIQARWGSHSLIDATRVLFASALTNPFVTKLVLVSESDIPLYGPNFVYSQLLSERKSRINACNTTSTWDRNQYRLRYDFQEAGITWEIWRKSWQWVALTRSHGMMVVKDTKIDAIFRTLCRPRWDHDWCDFRVCYSDEHYISTLLAVHGQDNMTDCHGELTDRDWSRVRSTDAHPYQYKRKDITKDLFNNLRHPEISGCERSDFIQETVLEEFLSLSVLISDAENKITQSVCSSTPSKSATFFSPLGSSCPLLARKFSNETADLIENFAPSIFGQSLSQI